MRNSENKVMDIFTPIENIKFEKIEKIVNVVKSSSFMEENEISNICRLVSGGKIRHLRCFENAYWIAKELSIHSEGEWGLVEGFCVDKKISRKGVKGPVWHVINYLKWDNMVYYFDITAENFDDQRYPDFYAVRQYRIEESEKIVSEHGMPIPTHILCYDDKKFFYYKNNGELSVVDILKNNDILVRHPFYAKMTNVVYPKKYSQLYLDTVCQKEYVFDIQGSKPCFLNNEVARSSYAA